MNKVKIVFKNKIQNRASIYSFLKKLDIVRPLDKKAIGRDSELNNVYVICETNVALHEIERQDEVAFVRLKLS